MRELLDGELAPVTWEIGFVEADAAEAVERFAAWWKAPVWFLRRSVRVRRVEGDLRTLLCALDPLVDIETSRFLFVPTRSGWTAFFDNTEQGTESSGVMSVLAEDLRCRGVRARLTPEDGTDAGGAVIFELYGPEAK